MRSDVPNEGFLVYAFKAMQPVSDVTRMMYENTNELLLPIIELLPSLASSARVYTSDLLAISESLVLAMSRQTL